MDFKIILSFVRKYAKYIALGLLLFIGIATFIAIGNVFSGRINRDIVNSPPFLQELKQIKDLHVCRFVVSDYRTYKIGKDGNVSEKGKEVEYVTVNTVDAYIPLDKIILEVDYSNDEVIIKVPKIQIRDGVIDEGISFVWQNNARDFNVSNIAQISQKRASAKALSMGINKMAKENIRIFFEGFLKNLGYSTVRLEFDTQQEKLLDRQI